MPLSPSQTSEVEELLAQYVATMAALEAASTASAWSGFEQVEDWWDQAQTTAAVLFAMQVAAELRQQTGGATAQYIAQVLAIMTGRPLAAVLPLVTGRRMGVSPFGVWSRPIRTYRDAVALGDDPLDALAKARNRADVLALADSMLVARDTALATFEREGITGYRRIIRPELAKSGQSCGMCIVASDRIYQRRDLMPLHDRCNCAILPVVGDLDPGLRINTDDLNQLYADAGGKQAKQLKRTRYRVEEHGELGPVLVYEDHKTGTRKTIAVDLLSRFERAVAQSRLDPSRYPANVRDYQRTRISQLRRLADAA